MLRRAAGSPLHWHLPTTGTGRRLRRRNYRRASSAAGSGPAPAPHKSRVPTLTQRISPPPDGGSCVELTADTCAMRRRLRCHRCHVSEGASSTARCASLDCSSDAALGADGMRAMQRTGMRARSAPLDTLANSWAALETRAPSRAGTVSRAGSRASRQGPRAAASRGSHGMPQSGRSGPHRDERTNEIQRLQNEIRSIKTACVHCYQ